MEKILGALLVICLVLVVVSKVSAGFEDRRFEEQRIALVGSIQSILVETGVCVSVNECNKKKLLFVSPARSGVDVKLYGVNRPEVVEKIANECVTRFFELNREMWIVLEAYQGTKDEDLKISFWSSNKPYLVVKLKGDK